MGCWVALDRAVAPRRDRRRSPPATPTGGSAKRDEIHAWVDEHCWSAAKSCYTFYAGTDDLDAATLLAARTGFDRGERLAGTVAAVRRELGPADARCSTATPGWTPRRGASWPAPSGWSSALTALGRLDEARAVMDGAVRLGNDVGLLAERWIRAPAPMLGNLPQA